MQCSSVVHRRNAPAVVASIVLLAAAAFPTVAAAANLAPSISGTPATKVYVGSQYSFRPTASDPEGAVLKFSISNKPGWASFSTSTGRLYGTPTAVGLWENIQIRVSDGVNTRSLKAFSVRAVSRSNVAPTISGTPPTSATVGSPYSFQPTANDSNGDPLTFNISKRPGWATFDYRTGRLSGTPSASHVGTYPYISISVTDGSVRRYLPKFTITVKAASTSNSAPVISGSPATAVVAGSTYSFQPTASDANGDQLAFSISNKPVWAVFSTATGRLSGTPSASHVGSYPSIAIRVSDGKVSTALPAFTINVNAGANAAPVISGSPATSVNAGGTYSFRPTASDANGDALTFSIANKPAWASFNASTGLLSGSPSATHTGTYSGIVISVSDGKVSAALPVFSITVAQASIGSATLSWTPPTQNTDGSTLTNLAGYRIHYGVSASALTHSIQVANPGLTSYVIENLSPGTYYFSVRAYASDGAESASSNLVTTIIQ